MKDSAVKSAVMKRSTDRKGMDIWQVNVENHDDNTFGEDVERKEPKL